MTGSRSLTVEIDIGSIRDGDAPRPQIGAVLTGPLRFVESSEPDPDPAAVHITADLSASGERPSPEYVDGRRSGRWHWSGCLSGDGWTAAWAGHRPRTGRVELTGRFHSGFSYLPGRFSGRVTRIQIVSELRRHGQDGAPTDGAAGPRRVREADTLPDTIDEVDARSGPPDEQSDIDVAVLVDLDLDDVPDVPVRPEFVPGDVSVSGAVLWAVDSELPVIVSADAEGPVVHHVIPGRVGVPRRVWATAAGCWVAGGDGTFWIQRHDEPLNVDDLPVLTGAVHGNAFLGCTGTDVWRLYSPGTRPIVVCAVQGHVWSIAIDTQGFIVVVQQAGSGLRLVRVSLTGESEVGPDLLAANKSDEAKHPWPGRRPYLLGNPVRMVIGSKIRTITSSLHIEASDERLGDSRLRGGQVGDFAWMLGYMPTGRPGSGWWPLSGRHLHDIDRRYHLLTICDARTLEPLTSVPVTSGLSSVTVDDDGRMFIISDGIKVFGADHPELSSPLDLDLSTYP